ncbi:MAG: ATP synthase subunit I [Methylotenera sp.]|uniref:ATP synthase subunit I n=1 Tax=Methylotenera sp. TaxID=2051956 RepID=UPI002487C2DE|nr:ATP synthase subunit I [Methylotenera sp.]MDI1308965.1 ATP synthase subunit I [Methylotenera sp.]
MENTTASVFNNMLRLQLIVTVLITLTAFALSGINAGISGLIGGLSVLIGAYFSSRVAGREAKTPSSALLNLLKAEALKILIIIVVLFVSFKFYKQLIPPALLAGVAGTALISGAAIGKLKKSNIKI